MVGKSGSAAERFAVVTASARTPPDWTCGRIAVMVSKIIAVRPPSRSGWAAELPR